METKVNQHPSPGLPDVSKASFKLAIYFKDGTKRTFYNYHTSYNAEFKKVIICEKTGLSKLQRMIIQKYTGQYKTALLYYIDPIKKIVDQYGTERKAETQLMKYCYDKCIQVLPYIFEFRDGAVRIKLNDSNKAG